MIYGSTGTILRLPFVREILNKVTPMDSTSERKVSAHLDLVRGKNQKISYTLYNERYLTVNIANRRKKLNYKLDLLSLAPGCTKRYCLGWHWLALSLIPAIVGGYFLLNVINLGATGAVTDLIIAVATFILCVAGIMQFVITSLTVTEFYSLHGGIALVEVRAKLLASKDSRKQVVNFTEALGKSIDYCKRKMKVADGNQKAGELRTLRRLAEQGVIPQNKYESVKQIILGIS